jgi:ribosomal protein S18 acetylase RimI-like enzyme
MESFVRRAVPQDAEEIAEVHIRTWQIAYRGQLPDEFLDNLGPTLQRRIEFWRTQISTPPAPQHEVWVAGRGSRVHGFVAIGPARDADQTTGELYAIYVDPKHWHKGLGRALCAHAANRLAAHGYQTAILWVLESNVRVRRFYEIGGWSLDGGSKVESRPGDVELREVRYRFDFRREKEES